MGEKKSFPFCFSLRSNRTVKKCYCCYETLYVTYLHMRLLLERNERERGEREKESE